VVLNDEDTALIKNF